ncbi:Molybdopterin-synthase adenylyltransferase [hydrothermal vent metagenome]|uniref:Molybdopterin-synthase adenylyltransferase n=1 Tax=hydrothermal vent metagenome TaxID=652676 RepID=A0A3B0Y4Z1_9ZZZZ
MDDNQLLRYSRQILLPQFGTDGQQTLLDSRVLVIGAGGLGSPAALYLAAAGVGQLVIADDDEVDLSNLQRQILHRYCDIGKPKVDSAKDTLNALNPDVDVITLATRLQGEALNAEVRKADLVVDASDNFDTRFAVNRTCVETATALVSGAAIRMEGQVSVFLPEDPDSPCYRCLYREGEDPEQTCADNGVLSPIVGIIGSLQALEAIKVLLKLGDTLCGRLLVFDGLYNEWRSMKLRRDPACPVCGNRKT